MAADDRSGTSILAALTALAAFAVTARVRVWSVVAVQLLLCMCTTSIAYLGYAAAQSAAQARTLVVVVGSGVVWLLEVGALALTVSYTFEILDVLGRRRRPSFAFVALDHWPVVAIQVPTYNEPVNVVRPTLEALARLDYPSARPGRDNNTTDPATWQPLERLCADRFVIYIIDALPSASTSPSATSGATPSPSAPPLPAGSPTG